MLSDEGGIGAALLGVCIVTAAKIWARVKGKSDVDAVDKRFCDERSCAIRTRLDRDESEINSLWDRVDGGQNAANYHDRGGSD